MPTIPVVCGAHRTPVCVEAGLLGRAGEALAPHLSPRRILLVADAVAGSLFGEFVIASLARAGFVPHPVTCWGGEPAKQLATVDELWRQCAAARLGRDGAIVALGGGCVSDVAGFAAATWNRGIPWAVLPTTLLAQVDAAIGGKTAINRPEGKNLVGAFHQPAVVCCDPEALRTLPARELRSGLAEVVKAGVIGDAALFARCERDAAALLAREPAACADVVARAIAVKAALVSADERETGVRAHLNLGHTLGHALEAAGGFARFTHGEAVAIGLAAACRIAVARGTLPAADATRIVGVLEGLGLPTVAPRDVDPAGVAAALAVDKKARAARIRWVLPRGIGRVEVVDDAGEAATPARWLGLA